MSEQGPISAPDPYRYLAMWGLRVTHRAFDLMVARQMIWLPLAKPPIRQMLFTKEEQPICPACGEIVVPGTPSIVSVAVLADQPLQHRLDQDPYTLMALMGRGPDSSEAWWLLHGTCFDGLTPERIHDLDKRIELGLRAGTMLN